MSIWNTIQQLQCAEMRKSSATYSFQERLVAISATVRLRNGVNRFVCRQADPGAERFPTKTADVIASFSSFVSMLKSAQPVRSQEYVATDEHVPDGPSERQSSKNSCHNDRSDCRYRFRQLRITVRVKPIHPSIRNSIRKTCKRPRLLRLVVAHSDSLDAGRPICVVP